jgi:hypothetical protein
MNRPSPSPSRGETTRRHLHAVAELLLAGPQYRTSGTIRLRLAPGGFATIAPPALRVDRGDLVVGVTGPVGESGERRIRMAGASIRELAAAAGVTAGAPGNLYHDGSGAEPDDVVEVDPDASAALAGWFGLGDRALRRLVADATPVLWPEHFDLGVTLDEVNYGVSPGDSWSPAPYAYVGPRTPFAGEFWNAPFGAARPAADLEDEDALLDFFQQGRRAAAS